ncbi:DNA-directed RNA polymerase subunit beta [Candidatus Campbellbacteria bacterium]|nr:MAG: DNA-directed RNA polymerase subunit beta [Candidatus Campbellbacteria bacterium]
MQQKVFAKYQKPLLELPNLAEAQLVSFRWLMEKGVKELLKEFSPISDYSGKKFELHLSNPVFTESLHDEYYAKENKLSYEVQLKVTAKLINKTLGTEKEQEIFLSDMPIQTDRGTFVINGVERVIVSQLIRSFGVLFTSQEFRGKEYFGAKIIPSRGAWIEIETEPNASLQVRIDRKRKFPVTHLLRVLGVHTKEDILKLFAGTPALPFIEKTFAHDTAQTIDDSFIEIHKKLRDGELATAENARDFVNSIFNAERYDLSEVGRFRFNQRFGKSMDKKAMGERTLSLDDLITIINKIVELNTTPDARADDVDDLSSRRVRYVGEMMQQKMRVGFARMKRNIQDRMSIIDADTTMPTQVINPRPLQGQIREFFSTNQLCQFMAQENILAEMEHLRTLSALGPGGLSRERAGFEVRDVHVSHYGRLCPICTPEGPNIGLILHLATYARINDFGIIETPYMKVVNGIVTTEVAYLNAQDEQNYKIAHAAIARDEKGVITDDRVDVRVKGRPVSVSPKDVEFIDVATNQAYSIATSLVPFLNHDEANRALMASNMQKQAVPCIRPEAPLVATGIEERAARDSGRLVYAREAGKVSYVDAKKIVVKNAKGKDDEYRLITFSRTNGFTVFHQRPSVSVGDTVKRGDLLADTSTSANGQIALGQNLLVAFMPWSGNNFEDAIILSERLVRDNYLTSIHIEEFSSNVRDTKLGPEVTTNDIPNVGELKLRNLDEEGIIRIGSEVQPGDILVGKITPKGESQLTPEERLLRSIFGDKARDVKDTSLRMEGGKRGRVVGIKVFSREKGDQLESGIIKKIYIEIAQLRNITVGDKLAGRHGNKGVISRVVPIEDMPHMADGTPVDVILTPLGVPSRMNLGQILELHLGMAAKTLGYQAIVPPFVGATEEEIKSELKEAGFSETGKMKLIDGRTGEQFENDISVGYMYILKLEHMVEDKIHMRSIGPYSLITQQPLGGRAQNGGQRFGEMEVWALLGYGAAYTLREMLTIKSDDIMGRSAAFDSIVRGSRLTQPNTPASFSVLLHYLRGLALDVELKEENE